MKKLSTTFIIILSMIISQVPLSAQITLEQVYPNASLGLYMVDLELSGMKYLEKNDDQGNRFLKFYNLDHSLWKTIDCNAFPVTESCVGGYIQYFFDAIYISETLFDCDSAIEFLYISSAGCPWFTGIYKEDGTALLIADSCAPLVKINVPQQWRPIYNTPEGTKLILSHMDGTARIYELPCSLSTGTDQIIPLNIEEANLKVFPNPSFYQNTIEYKLPKDINHAEIVITDLEGRELKRYKVDNTFSSLLITHNEITPGTYFYSLIAGDQILDSKKIILLK